MKETFTKLRRSHRVVAIMYLIDHPSGTASLFFFSSLQPPTKASIRCEVSLSGDDEGGEELRKGGRKRKRGLVWVGKGRRRSMKTERVLTRHKTLEGENAERLESNLTDVRKQGRHGADNAPVLFSKCR